MDIKKLLLFFLEDIQIKFSKFLINSLKISNELIIINIFYAIQFFSWICFYGLVAWKFNSFYNFILFLFLFIEIRRRFQDVEEKTKLNIKVLHSNVIGCFFLTFGYIIMFLLLCIFFKNILIKIIFSVLISLNTIDFSKNKLIINIQENGLMARKGQNIDLEQRLKKYYIIDSEEEKFIKILNNIYFAFPVYKEISIMIFAQNKNMTEIAMTLNLSYETIHRYKKNFLRILNDCLQMIK